MRPLTVGLLCVAAVGTVAGAAVHRVDASSCALSGLRSEQAKVLCETFALFRRPSDRHRLPKAIARSPVVRKHRLRLSTARRLAVRRPGLWLIASDDEVCLIRAARGFVASTCNPTADLVRHGTYLASICLAEVPDDRYEVVGVAQDRATNLRVVMSDGSSQSISARGNSFKRLIARSPRRPWPRQLRWAAPQGAVSFALAMTRRDATAQCA